MKKKRTTKRKKMSTGGKIAIGVAVLGGAYLGWEYLIKPMLNKEEPKKKEEEPKTTPATQAAVDTVVQAVQQIPANVVPAEQPAQSRLSPIGTPYKDLKLDARIWFGDKGAEVEFIQGILNKMVPYLNEYQKKFSKEAGIKYEETKTITPDGDYGKKTYALMKLFFKDDERKNGINIKYASGKYAKMIKEFPQRLVELNQPGWMLNL